MFKNNHVKKYLKYYCDEKNITPFAVLLKGKWGCGKTHFIKNYIKEQQNKFLHISLYGLSECSEIDEKIVVQIFKNYLQKKNNRFTNFLKNKKLQKVSNFSANLILKKYKVDKNDIFRLLNNSSNETIIFDDLERCNIAIDKVLGYINHLVEFQNQKVILIMDENKILESDEGKKYREIKEKLIGKEFVINPNPEEAIKIFTERIGDKKIKKSSKKVKELLLKIFYQSKYDNLRLIDQALSHFEYFFRSIPNKIQNNSELFEKMFYEFIVIFIEYKKGKIKNKEFFEKWPQFFKGLSEEKGSFGENIETKHFLDKYDNLSYCMTCFDVKILGKILQGVSQTKNEESKLIEKLERLIGINKESWMILWDFRENSDEVFFQNLKEVKEKWKNREYLDFFVVLHIFGMFLNFSEIGFPIEKSKRDIFKEGKEYIEFLIKEKKFPLDLWEQAFYSRWKESAYGLGYCGSNNNEWKEFLNSIDEKIKKLKEVSIKEKIKNELMPILRGEKEPDQDLDLLINYNFIHCRGEHEAYFQYLNAHEIMRILTKENRKFLYVLNKVFKERYTSRKDKIKNIKAEVPFLKSLKKELEKEIKKTEEKFGNKKTPKSFLLQGFIDEALTPFIINNKFKK
jgi:DNA polymerase III delta prime subunit